MVMSGKYVNNDLELNTMSLGTYMLIYFSIYREILY